MKPFPIFRAAGNAKPRQLSWASGIGCKRRQRLMLSEKEQVMLILALERLE
ncbi:MAG: hypothetical protein G8345_13160 [Magnetococcales bacterium]|nr:hypothetical protein [Magnetococcales bacterium]NGZ27822.1 hypothetical protein [Magnetococcales bacterium]